MPSIFILDSAFAVFSSRHILDLYSRTFAVLTLDRQVNINTKLSIFDLRVRNAQILEQFLELAHNQFCITWMRGLMPGDDFEQGHTRPVVVDHDFVAVVDRLGCVLLHLDALDQNMAFLVIVVVEVEAPIHHYRVVLLRDLVRLGKVSVHIVLPVEFNLGQYMAIQTQRGTDR